MATYQEQIDRMNRENEKKKLANTERQLSQDQVANWRIVLRNMGVPLAMTMPESMVQKFRDALQARIDTETASREKKRRR